MNGPKPGPQFLSMGKALTWILISVLIVSGGCLLGISYVRYVRESYAQDPKHEVVAIVQTCNENEHLKTLYLAELLDLSIDKPVNLYNFSSKEAKKKLLRCPLIKSAEIKKIKPGTIYVDYTLRKPIAFLRDYSNTAIDKDGFAIPFKPFFTPKKFPEIVLGTPESFPEPKWGARLEYPKSKLALVLHKILNEKCCEGDTVIKRLDVSKAFGTSYGQREIVVMLEERMETHSPGHPQMVVMSRVLRLCPEHLECQLANYLKLREHLKAELDKGTGVDKTSILQSSNIIIDLRIPHLAFICKAE